jgi:putative ABC transport system ATP-binding protein
MPALGVPEEASSWMDGLRAVRKSEPRHITKPKRIIGLLRASYALEMSKFATAPPEVADISLRGVSRFFELGDEKIHAIRNLTLDIRQGEFVAIKGPSGSGKSTLANVIGGLDTPNEGNIVVGGLDFNKANDKELSHYRSHTIGFVFQSFNLQAHTTVLENVLLPLVIAGVDRDTRLKRARECVELMGLGDRADQPTNKLSGGQRQRVSIARALANWPQIIIADEPTGNLDQANGQIVIDYLTRLNRELNITLILITHDADVANKAPRVLEIVDGTVTDRKRA